MSSSKNILKQKDFEKNSKSSKLSSGKNSIVKNKKQNDLKKNLKNSKSKNESQKSSLSKQAGKRIGSKRWNLKSLLHDRVYPLEKDHF